MADSDRFDERAYIPVSVSPEGQISSCTPGGSASSHGLSTIVWCTECKAIHLAARKEPRPCPACGSTVSTAAGNEGELAKALHDAYESKLLKYVLHHIAHRGLSEAQVDPELIVRETFEALLKTRTPIWYPRSWLASVARRKIDNSIARGQRFINGDLHEFQNANDFGWSSISRTPSIEAHYNARVIMGAIGNLPYNQRAAVYLSKVQGWTYAEIGEHLGCAVGTVNSHVHRGVKAVRIATRGMLISATFIFAGCLIARIGHDIKGVAPAFDPGGLVFLLATMAAMLLIRMGENRPAAIAMVIFSIITAAFVTCMELYGVIRAPSDPSMLYLIPFLSFSWIFFPSRASEDSSDAAH